MFSIISFEKLYTIASWIVYIYGYIALFILCIIGSFTLYTALSIILSFNESDKYATYMGIKKYIIDLIRFCIEESQVNISNSSRSTSIFNEFWCNKYLEQIVISDCKQYYTYKGVHYDIAFPLFWCLTHTAGTGPHECANCQDYGCLRGVFIMYCANCAAEYQDNAVGYGAIYNGIEKCKGHVNLSAWYTYLKYRNIKYIGLPEERELCGFDDDRYKYELVEFTDDDGVFVCIQPDFVVNIPYDEVFEYDEVEEGEIVDDVEEEEGEIVDDLEEEGDNEGAEVDDM